MKRLLGRRDFLQMSSSMMLIAQAGSTSNFGGATQAAFAGSKSCGFVVELVDRDDAFYNALAATGAKLARTFFKFSASPDLTTFSWSDADYQLLSSTLKRLASKGIRLVIAAELGTVGQSAAFWRNLPLQSSFVDSWENLAIKLGNDPAIAGFDLFNEPNPPWSGGRVSEAVARWRPLASRIIDAIRNNGIRVTVVVEGVVGGSALGFRDFEPIVDTSIAYSAHMYWPLEITHQFVLPKMSRSIPYPAGIEWGISAWDPSIGVTAWNAATLERTMQDLIACQRRTNAPIYIGEFSCVRWAPKGSAYRYVEDCLNIFKKYNWSWTYHEFRAWPGWDAEIDSEDKSITTRSADATIMRQLALAIKG